MPQTTRSLPALLTLASAFALSACATTATADPALPANMGALTAAEAEAAVAPSVPIMKAMTQRLAADEFEGRAPSTAVEPKVLDYIVAEFEKAGLKPGNKGRWLQDVPTVEITGSNYSPLAIRAPDGKTQSFAFGDQYVAASYRVTPQTHIDNAPLVFVGYGINAPELGWNDYAGVDMKGKIAVILVNDPDYAMEGQDGLFKGRRMTYYGRWTYKFEEAARQGAAGALIVHDTFPAAYGWSVVNSSWTGSQYYVQSANDGMDQTQANGWIQLPVADAIMKAAGKDLRTLTVAAGRKGFQPVPLNLTASLGFDNAIRRSKSANVVGILPGKTRPDEYVLYSAHWDHLGRCTADKTGDDICNGAVDNATGVGAIAALADAQRRNGGAARSQVFLAVTLEESGLLGSRYYAENPIYPLNRTVGGVNIDALLPGPRTRSYASTGGDKSELADIFRTALAEQGLTEAAEDSPERGSYYRSDHFSLAKLGVPMFYVGRGVDLVDGGPAAGKALREDYTATRYHAPGDEWSDNWDWSGMTQDLGLYYRLGTMLANGSAWPNWRPTDEFRAIRDRDCAKTGAGC